MQDEKCEMTQLQNVQRKRNLFYKLMFLLMVVLVILTTTSSLVKPSRATNKLMGEDLAKYQHEIEVLKSKMKQVEDLQSKPVEKLSDSFSMKDMKFNFDARISRIEDLLQGDPVRSLSVPLLRRDLDNVSSRITEYQVAIREDINRIYNILMWAFGILFTVMCGAFGYFQRKLDDFIRPTEKE